MPLLHDAEERIREDAPVAAPFVRLDFGEQVLPLDELEQEGARLRLIGEQKDLKRLAYQLVGALESIHAREGVVALRKPRPPQHALHLDRGRQRDRQFLLSLETVDPLGAQRDEGAISLLAGPQRVVGLATLRDVRLDRDVTRERPVVCEEGRGIHTNPEQAAVLAPVQYLGGKRYPASHALADVGDRRRIGAGHLQHVAWPAPSKIVDTEAGEPDEALVYPLRAALVVSDYDAVGGTGRDEGEPPGLRLLLPKRILRAFPLGDIGDSRQQCAARERSQGDVNGERRAVRPMRGQVS